VTQLRVRRIAYALGAEVRGVDLKRALDDDAIAEIRQAWLEHLVLCFPGQDLSYHEVLAFARRFGEPGRVGKAIPLSDSPYITFVTEKPVNGRPWDGVKGGEVWHTDKSYTPHPSAGSFLHCKEIPEAGGDTMFANQYMAYETLSPTMREIIDRLSAIHDASLRLRKFGDVKRPEDAPEHPVVRVHDETGRKALYIGHFVRQIVGMTEEESRPLLDFLKEHAVRYEFTYRHRWTVNDLLMWDNRCMLHLALFDYDLQHDPRFMVKCEVLGPKSGSLVRSG
jgi:taurine dioxygenase